MKPLEIPAGYNIAMGMVINLSVGIQGVLLFIYRVRGIATARAGQRCARAARAKACARTPAHEVTDQPEEHSA